MLDPVRRLVEHLLPWYDPADVARRREETDRALRSSQRVRARAELELRRTDQATAGYRAYGRAMHR